MLEGQAESNSRVSDYLRRLDESEWLEKPDLQFIEAEGSPGSKSKAPKGAEDDGLPFLFKIQVSLVNPTQPTDGDDEEGEASAPKEAAPAAPDVAPAPSAPTPESPAPGVTPAQAPSSGEVTPIQPPAAAPAPAPGSQPSPTPAPRSPEPAVAPSQES